MRIIILLVLHSFITVVIPSKICFQLPCSASATTTTTTTASTETTATTTAAITNITTRVFSFEGSYNEALEFCSNQGPMRMPYYYDNVDKYSCHTLLYQGPCGPGHWFVANNFSDIPSAECQKRKCRDNEIYFHEECWKNDSSTALCGQSQILHLNPFGEGKFVRKNDNLVFIYFKKISKDL